MSQDFWELARAAEADPASADFAALRKAYVASDAYRPLKHITKTKLMQITNSAADFEDVAATCQAILAANPLDLEARILLGTAQEKLGKVADAEKTHTFAERMLDAILATGDGKSFGTAFKLVSETEAWIVMRSFGIKAKSQERHRRAEGIFDVFEGKLGDRQVQVYFDVADPVRVLDETLEQSEDELR